MITTLTTVTLPDDVKGRVDRVVCGMAEIGAFYICGRRCFVSGNNRTGCLGLGSEHVIVTTPIEQPFPVDDVVCGISTIFISNGRVMACGDNLHGHIDPHGGEAVIGPIPLRLPRDATRVAADTLSVSYKGYKGRDGWRVWASTGRRYRWRGGTVAHHVEAHPPGVVMDVPRPTPDKSGCRSM